MSLRWTSSTMLLGLVTGCFSPNANGDESEGGTETTGSDTGGTASMTSESMTTMSDASASGTTSSTTTGPTADTTATETGPDPFCGDGNVDPGEECDDGENNGLDQACRPDCTLQSCGDGDVGPEEFCDEGNDNALEIGACAPDCSRVIETKTITVFPESLVAGTDVGPLTDGDFGGDPVPQLDDACDSRLSGAKALFADEGARRAASMPYVSDPLDWVLQPYTAYVDSEGELIWITDGTPLLGVRRGQPMPLQKGITNTTLPSITGMNQDWTTANSGTCNGWSSDSNELAVATGSWASTEEYLRGFSTEECGSWNWAPQGQPALGERAVIACVEQ